MNTINKTYADLLSWKQKRDRYSIKLARRHGQAILEDYIALNSKPYWNLTDIAKKYGFTRERARQIYNRLFRTPYIFIKKRKTREKNEQINAMNRACDPRQKVATYNSGTILKGAEVELLAFQKMVELGMNVEFQRNVSYDMVVNSYKVDIKSARIAQLMRPEGRARYFHFSITPRQLDICEFFICYPVPKGVFYIIPRSRLKSKAIYIRENDNHQHPTMPYLTKNNTNYREYKEAWHLLN